MTKKRSLAPQASASANSATPTCYVVDSRFVLLNRAFNEENNNLCFENCASTFLKKVYEFVNTLVDLYVRPRIGVASRRVLGLERYFATHFVLQNIAPPAECAGRQRRFGAYVHVLQTPFSNMFWGLMQIWWLDFAEPLYGEAGAKAPASLNFSSD